MGGLRTFASAFLPKLIVEPPAAAQAAAAQHGDMAPPIASCQPHSWCGIAMKFSAAGVVVAAAPAACRPGCGPALLDLAAPSCRRSARPFRPWLCDGHASHAHGAPHDAPVSSSGWRLACQHRRQVGWGWQVPRVLQAPVSSSGWRLACQHRRQAAYLGPRQARQSPAPPRLQNHSRDFWASSTSLWLAKNSVKVLQRIGDLGHPRIDRDQAEAFRSQRANYAACAPTSSLAKARGRDRARL